MWNEQLYLQPAFNHYSCSWFQLLNKVEEDNAPFTQNNSSDLVSAVGYRKQLVSINS